MPLGTANSNESKITLESQDDSFMMTTTLLLPMNEPTSPCLNLVSLLLYQVQYLAHQFKLHQKHGIVSMQF